MVQKYWDSIPCGSQEPAESIDDPQFFRSHSRIRYEREPEILTFADFESWKGRRVLEIGVGLGADFVQFSRAGARSAGIDLSHQSVKLARRNAQLNNVPESLANGDAELLPFRDEAFDLVYSWGVFHHTPDPARAVGEVYRVLKPGGECRIMVYHRRSLAAPKLSRSAMSGLFSAGFEASVLRPSSPPMTCAWGGAGSPQGGRCAWSPVAWAGSCSFQAGSDSNTWAGLALPQCGPFLLTQPTVDSQTE